MRWLPQFLLCSDFVRLRTELGVRGRWEGGGREEHDDITPEQTMLRRTRSVLVRKNRGRGWQSRSIGIRFETFQDGRSGTLPRNEQVLSSLCARRGGGAGGRINPSRFTSVILRPPTTYATCLSQVFFTNEYVSHEHTLFSFFSSLYVCTYIYAYIFFLLDDRRRENRDDSRPRCVSIFGKRRMVGQKLEKSVTESTNEADEDRGLSDKKGRLDDL